MKYIDIHTHIAYAIDDGISRKEDMMIAFNEARKQGYEAIFMTPHITCGDHDSAYLSLIDQRYREIKEIASKYHIDIYLGNELLLNEKVYKMIHNYSFYTMNDTKYVLVEANLRQSSETVMQIFDLCLNELLAKGYIPILAHLERYFKKGIDLEYVKYLKDKGCLIQVNTTSILKEGYESDYNNAMLLLDSQYVSFIASDAHRSKSKEVRILNMDQCYKTMVKMGFDLNYLKDLMYENPKKIIVNQKIHCNKYKKRSIIKKLIYK